MPKRSLRGTIDHLKRVHGEAAVRAEWVLQPRRAPSTGHRRLVERVRKDILVDPRAKKARTLRRQGKPTEEIAQLLGVAERTVRNLSVHRRLLADPWVEGARRLRREGKKVSAIAQTLDVSESTVRRWLRPPDPRVDRARRLRRRGESVAGIARILGATARIVLGWLRQRRSRVRLRDDGGYAHVRLPRGGSVPLVALCLECTGRSHAADRGDGERAALPVDAATAAVKSELSPEEQVYAEIVDAARLAGANRIVAEFPDTAAMTAALHTVQKVLGPDGIPRSGIEFRNAQGSPGRWLPPVTRREHQRKCDYSTFAAAKCAPEVDLTGREGHGYCRSCKRWRIFEVVAQRPLPYENARKWLRSRNPEFLMLQPGANLDYFRQLLQQRYRGKGWGTLDRPGDYPAGTKVRFL